jgi:hypothetical protein
MVALPNRYTATSVTIYFVINFLPDDEWRQNTFVVSSQETPHKVILRKNA